MNLAWLLLFLVAGAFFLRVGRRGISRILVFPAIYAGSVVVVVTDTDVARIQEQIKTLFGDVTELKCDLKEIKEQLANRLPLWATVLMSILTGALGWAIGR